MRMSEYWKAQKEKVLTENAERVERFERLQILREGTPEKPCVRIWRGDQGRPFANFIFRNEAGREKYIEDQKVNEKGWLEARSKWKAEKRSRDVQALAQTKVGDILYTTWGYDQTNVDWFQVVRKTTSMFVVRPIGNTYKEDGFMTGEEMPLKDKFGGEEELVRPGKYYPWSGRPVRSSSYA